MKHQKTLYILLTLLTTFAGQAVDGVVEINQTCATQLGCFSGDTSGFPLTIDGSSGSSFRLTSNLLIPDKDTVAIRINSNNINIDFNGFSIIRSSCFGKQCSVDVGSGKGLTSGNVVSNINIKNGSIIGMGSTGISFGFVRSSITVENMQISYNGGNGIYVQGGSIVKNNLINNNNSDGVDAGLNSNIIGNIIHDNAKGIHAISSIVQSNNVYSNSLDGIHCFSACNIKGNHVYNNSGDGVEIRISNFSTQGSLVQGNTIAGNAEYGIRFSNSRSAYQGNVITNNFSGTVTSNGFNLGNNYCTSNDVCP